MKKWKLLIPIAAVAAFLPRYASGPNGSWLIGVSMKPCLPRKVVRRRSRLSPDSSTVSCTQRQVLQPSTGWEMAVVFFALRASAHQTVRMCTSTWSPLSDAKDSARVLRAGFIDLGTIKGNIGDQNYSLGPEVDLSKYRAVSVWCKRFSVNFGGARLIPDQAVSEK